MDPYCAACTDLRVGAIFFCRSDTASDRRPTNAMHAPAFAPHRPLYMAIEGIDVGCDLNLPPPPQSPPILPPSRRNLSLPASSPSLANDRSGPRASPKFLAVPQSDAVAARLALRGLHTAAEATTTRRKSDTPTPRASVGHTGTPSMG
jgi:hypothetical protein